MHRIENKARREHRTFHLSHNTTTTYYYTDASYNNETKLGNTAVVGPEFKKAHHHSNAPTSTSLEFQAIAEAIQQHNGTDNITIRTDSQSSIRHFRQNTLPVHIRAVLAKHMYEHPKLHVFLEWIPGHQGIEGNALAHELAPDHAPRGPPTPWPQDYDPYDHRKILHKERTRALKELRHNNTSLRSPSRMLNREDATIIRRAQTGTLLTLHHKHHISGAPAEHKEAGPQNESANDPDPYSSVPQVPVDVGQRSASSKPRKKAVQGYQPPNPKKRQALHSALLAQLLKE
ncbi:uncharacterized protein ISCGN_015488 [Ixodes scapularis]